MEHSMSSTQSDADKLASTADIIAALASSPGMVSIMPQAEYAKTESLSERAMTAARQLAVRHREVKIIYDGNQFMVRAGDRASFHGGLERALLDRVQIDVNEVTGAIGGNDVAKSALYSPADHQHSIAIGKQAYIRR
jgi:hypothetical protein